MALAALALATSTAFVAWHTAEPAPAQPAAEAATPTLPAIPEVVADGVPQVERELYALDHTVVPLAPDPEPEPEPAPTPAPAPRPRRSVAAAEPAPAPPPPPVAVVSGLPGLDRVNGFRAANGVGPLGWDATLAGTAADWSAQMAAAGGISHRGNLFAGTSGCRRVAENVAYAGSLDRALGLLEDSPGHRSNLLDGSYDRIGIGVVESGGRVYVTQIFCG